MTRSHKQNQTRGMCPWRAKYPLPPPPPSDASWWSQPGLLPTHKSPPPPKQFTRSPPPHQLPSLNEACAAHCCSLGSNSFVGLLESHLQPRGTLCRHSVLTTASSGPHTGAGGGPHNEDHLGHEVIRSRITKSRRHMGTGYTTPCDLRPVPKP